MQTISSRNKLILIIALIACYAMIFIDESGIAVTLPTMQKAINLSNNGMHWVVNSYLLTLSVLLLLGGRLSDIYGTRLIFTLGVGIFIAGSILSAFALSTGMIISGRVIQGIGASLLMPCINVLIRANIPEEQYGKVFGLILGFSNFFYATAPFIGGLFTEYVTWRWFFGVNLPIGIISVSAILIATKTHTHARKKHFTDTPGLLSFIIGLSALILAIMQGAQWGWASALIIALFALAALSMAYFIKHELATKDPLLNLNLFKIKHFFAGNLILFCACACLSVMVFWALWLQISLHYSPTIVGTLLLPASLMFIFMPRVSGAWHDRKGSRSPLILGSLLILFGLLWVAITATNESYAWMFLGLITFGLGIPLTIPVSVMTVMSAVEEQHSGMASGTFTTIRQFALTCGIAILSAIVSTKSGSAYAYTKSLQYGMTATITLAAIACIVAFVFIKTPSASKG